MSRCQQPATTAPWTQRCTAAPSASLSPEPPQACSEPTPVANSVRQEESLTADTQGVGTSRAKPVLLGESCPGLLQRTAGVWEDSTAWPDVKVPPVYPLPTFIPSRQSPITKPNEVLGLLLEENSWAHPRCRGQGLRRERSPRSERPFPDIGIAPNQKVHETFLIVF